MSNIVQNRTSVAIQDPLTAFGELLQAELTPAMQLSAVYGVNSRLWSSSTDGEHGGVTHADQHAVLATGAAAGGWAQLQSRQYIKYRHAQGVLARFTSVFDTPAAGSIQYTMIGDAANGLGFGFNGTQFGIILIRDSVTEWIPQTSWNVDKMDGTGPSAMYLQPKFGNVFQVRFQHLGYGAQFFYIEDDNQGTMQLVHLRKYANSHTEVSLTNPSLPITSRVENTTNATNIVLRIPSAAAFCEGKAVVLGPQNAQGMSKDGISTTLTNIITIRNKSTYQLVANRVPVIIDGISVAVSGSKPARAKLILGTTLGGSPSYTSVSANDSVIEYDTAGTTVTGGTVLKEWTLAQTGSILLGKADLDIIIYPGEWLTIAAASTISTTDVTATIEWREDF